MNMNMSVGAEHSVCSVPSVSVQMQCERLECSFISVLPMWRAAKPSSSTCSTSSKLAHSRSDAPISSVWPRSSSRRCSSCTASQSRTLNRLALSVCSQTLRTEHKSERAFGSFEGSSRSRSSSLYSSTYDARSEHSTDALLLVSESGVAFAGEERSGSVEGDFRAAIRANMSRTARGITPNSSSGVVLRSNPPIVYVLPEP